MSSAPAERLGIKDRGRIKKGFKADLVLFDANVVIDNATFIAPQLTSGGIRSVFVNGSKVWDGEKITGTLSGTILRHQ